MSDTIKKQSETSPANHYPPPDTYHLSPANRQPFNRRFSFAFFLFPLALFLGTVILFALVWQVPFNYKIDPERDTHLDEPFLQNFHAVEPANGTSEANPFYYRWSKGEGRLTFPGIGRNSYQLKITLTANLNPNPQFQLYANETRIGGVYTVAEGIQTFEFDIPAEAIQGRSGDLTVFVQFTPFNPRGDPRTLGFAFLSAEISGSGSFPLIPAVNQMAYLLVTVLLVCAIVLISGGTALAASITGGIFALILAWVVVSARAWLTVFSERMVFALFLSLLAVTIFISIAWLIRKFLTGRSSVSGHPLSNGWSWAISIFGLALAVRFGGMIYPGMFSVDIGFHVNNYTALWENGEIFRKISSAEWGGRQTYYPPTSYIFAGLFRWLFEDTITLLRFWMCLLDSARALLIFFLVKRASGEARAGVISALLVVSMPVGLISVSFGQVAQLTGEFVALAILVMVVVYGHLLHKWQYFSPTLLLLIIAFVQHPGVILLTGLSFFVIAIVFFFRKREGNKALLVIFALALLISIGLYHRVTLVDMIPQAWQTLESKLSGKPLPNEAPKPGKFLVGGSVNDLRLGLRQRWVNDFGEFISGGLSGFWKEAQVYYQVIPLVFIPYALFRLFRQAFGSKGQRAEATTNDELPVTTPKDSSLRLAWASLAWISAVVIFAMVGLVLNLYVRYSLFLLPVVAACAGIALAQLWKRGEFWGRLLTVGICAFIFVSGLILYFDRVIYYIDYR